MQVGGLGRWDEKKSGGGGWVGETGRMREGVRNGEEEEGRGGVVVCIGQGVGGNFVVDVREVVLLLLTLDFFMSFLFSFFFLLFTLLLLDFF